jgi:hypothetical protein
VRRLVLALKAGVAPSQASRLQAMLSGPVRLGTVIPLLLATAGVGLLVGCGSNERLSSASGGPKPSSSTSSAETKRSADTSRSVPAAHATRKADRSDSVPAVEQMSVFSRPRTEVDVLPKELSYRLRDDIYSCTDWHREHDGCLGDPIADESRLLLSGLGVGNVSLYAWPTENGWVCWAWGNSGGGCAPHFTQERRVVFMGIDPDQECIGYPGTLLGVVPDEVVGAEVQVRGVRHPAIVESNAVFYELNDASFPMRAFDSLTATFSDGSTATDQIGWRTPARSDDTCAG